MTGASFQPVVGYPAARYDVGAVIAQHIQAYAEQYPLSDNQQGVVNALIACRTAQLGGHLQRCRSCHDTTPVYNSCRNRHCPKCQVAKQAVWLAKREHSILPTHYFHVVLTLPEALRELVRQNLFASGELSGQEFRSYVQSPLLSQPHSPTCKPRSRRTLRTPAGPENAPTAVLPGDGTPLARSNS